jgi:hypothetical protein
MQEGIYGSEQSEISFKILPDINMKKIIRRLSLSNSTLLKIRSRIMGLKVCQKSFSSYCKKLV